MTDHPILFNDAMVKALLDGRKTQTRRGAKSWLKVKEGDRLWVRETFRAEGDECSSMPTWQDVIYAAADDGTEGDGLAIGKDWEPPTNSLDNFYDPESGRSVYFDAPNCTPYWADSGESAQNEYDPVDGDDPTMLHLRARTKNIPSIYMPRWASRLTLIATADARVERLQDISEDDVLAEGAPGMVAGRYQCRECNGRGRSITHPNGCPNCRGAGDNAVSYWRELWQSLHTKPGERWEDNPELVVLTFRVVHGNIDGGAA